MRTSFETSDYVKGVTVAGVARAQAEAAIAQADAARPSGEMATLADLERLKARIDAAAAKARAELQRFRLFSLAGILLLCASILLLHFSRQ